MLIGGAGAGERIYGQFFLVNNTTYEGYHADPSVEATHWGKNLRGMPLSLQTDPIYFQQGFGIDVSPTTKVTYPVQGEEGTTTTVGVLVSDLYVGPKHNKAGVNNVWVKVQLYGLCERVIVSTGAAAADLCTVWSYAGSDFCVGLKQTNLFFGRSLRGIFTFADSTVGGERIDMALTANSSTAGTWNANRPTVDPLVTDTINPGQHGYIGLCEHRLPQSTAELPQAAVLGGYRKVFVQCLGRNFVVA